MTGKSRGVAARMDEIKEIFLQSQFISALQEDIGAIINKLNDTQPEYRLIAYEAAAMVLALNDLKDNDQLNRWRSFSEKVSKPIVPHAHLGLGWALSRENAPISILQSLDAAMRFRVVDGWGYYDGMFRNRQTIKLKKVPENFSSKALPVYDQGVGRSLWYASQGQVADLRETIESFPNSRHRDLWRGIGIACSFVGGCNEETLKTLSQIAGTNKTQLAVGTTMAAKARLQTHSPTNDTALACQVWCGLSDQEAMTLAVNTESNMEWIDEHWEDSYSLFVSEMIKGLSIINISFLEGQSK